jgi:hypothetical protein
MRESDEKTHLINSVSETFGSINTINNETNKPLKEGRQRTARYML